MNTSPTKRTIDIYTDETVQRLLECCPDTTAGIRNRALIHVLWKSGLRLAEALALIPGDVRTDAKGITRLNVRHGKGDKQRTAKLFNGAVVELDEWLKVRATLAVGADAPIFCTHSANRVGKALTQPYVGTMLKRLAADAGVTQRVHPHGFRHTFASELFYRDAPIAALQSQLGHNDPLTTQKYLKNIGCDVAAKILDSIDW